MSRDTENVIEVRGVAHRFGDHEALRGVHLDVPDGQVTALLGTNGAGKSTLFDAIEGHLAPDTGSIRVFGRDPRDRPRVHASTGVVLQQGGTAPDLSTSQCLRVLGDVSGRADDVDRMLTMVGLSEHARRPVKSLSGGERRRLDLAAAMWGSPNLLLLDEPTTGLDPAARGMIWKQIRALRQRGTTVLVSTHYLEEVEHHADRIALMHAGRVVESGTAPEILAREWGTVSFRSDAEPPHFDLQIDRLEDGLFTIRCADIQATVRAVLDWSDRNGHDVTDLSTTPPRLDSLFQRLTQRDDELEDR